MPKKIEEILGVTPFAGKRNVPGTLSVSGREYWYVEDDGRGRFDSLFQDLVSAVSPRRYESGGAITGGCELTLPDGRKFNALSFKGDLEGWREQIVGGARKLHLDAARAVDGQLIFVNGDTLRISDCTARFY